MNIGRSCFINKIDFVYLLDIHVVDKFRHELKMRPISPTQYLTYEFPVILTTGLKKHLHCKGKHEAIDYWRIKTKI